MKNKKDLRIEFKTVNILGVSEKYRYCFWRIVPSELKWWQRPFNRWKQIWYIDWGVKESWFTPGVFVDVKEKYKTVGDMMDRENRLTEKLKGLNSYGPAWDEAMKKST